ncbi:anaerobic sulfatase maturase [Vibrio comitans]|uniref:Anaerobic sulfatase maturase n=1 Tax=Vibrio comitans NBRC 102076 TaxID=1219078 RepID=A0A4Y3IM68_9VIBR|nr:anaerobic sulfatase maturase [Vibrio comitans]GEA60591.1 anaerobic sulfatase maturase [Vibrio comitans NBRC 102076]
MAKPTSSVCNIDCKYCFYLEKDKLYPERKNNWKMSQETLEIYVKQYIEANDSYEIEFAWQGGEPTLMGIEFFIKALEYQKKYSNGKKIKNTLQTNGLLINKEWCVFLSENNFLVGISIDGPEYLHDKYRVTRSGKKTHAKVVSTINLMKIHNVEFNTLVTINSENVKHPIEVYKFLVGIGSKYIQFIPIVERRSQNANIDGLYLISPEHNIKSDVTEWSVSSKEYGLFLSSIFDYWVRRDVGEIFINIFDSTLSTWCGLPPNNCVQAEVCGYAFVLEANGDIYNCDHFVYPEHKLGNIENVSLRRVASFDKAKEFGLSKKKSLTSQCKNCDYLFACNGGCPKHRFLNTSDGEYGLSYFCEGYKMFYSHIHRDMDIMKSFLNSGKSASNIVDKYLNIKKLSHVKRNSKCPCGSDRKYKNCCSKL